ncbi:hypothetical protein [Aggregatibacter kilianii]|uniref:hypothetical protein n=1 Tax=Aggregatibacter kilianii TaxID=2025884 RepID=UPI000D6527CE|nr:hypothetical protein [Aggregatibacter kilianii]
MIIMRRNVKILNQHNNYQSIYNIVNVILPIISMASILLGGVTAFIYLKSINHVSLLSSFTVTDFASISLSWFIFIFYIWFLSHFLSFMNIYILKEENNKNRINKKSNPLILNYILNIVTFLFLLLHYYICKNKENNYYSIWFNPVLITLTWGYLSYSIYKKIKKYYPDSLIFRVLTHIAILIYPIIFIFTPFYFIYKASYNHTDNYILFIMLSMIFSSVLGNFITIDIKDRKFKDILPKILFSITLTIFSITAPSQLFETNFSYTLLSILGKVDKTTKPYIIDTEFISKQGIKLSNPVKGTNIYCVKLMFNSGEKYIFTEDNKAPQQYLKYYEISNKNIELYQGDVKCEENSSKEKNDNLS